MDNAVAVVQGYFHPNSYFTVTEFPVIEAIGKGELKPQMEIGVVSRMLFDFLGNRGYGWFLRQHLSSPMLCKLLQIQYQHSFYKQLLLPWARWRYSSLCKDVTCNHVDCHCIWCREEYCIHD